MKDGKFCEVLKSICKWEYGEITRSDKIFGIRLVLEDGQEYACEQVSDDPCVAEGLRHLLLNNHVLYEELPYIVEDYIEDQYIVNP